MICGGPVVISGGPVVMSIGPVIVFGRLVVVSDG